jgi:hypothetical protein
MKALVTLLFILSKLASAEPVCSDLYGSSLIFSGDVERDDPKLKFSEMDVSPYSLIRFPPKEKKHLEIRRAEETPNFSNGVAVFNSKSAYNKKTDKAFNELSGTEKEGDLELFKLDEKVSDSEILNEYINKVVSQKVSGETAKYIEELFNEMIATARSASKGLKRARLLGFRLRWKQSGRGEDFDRVHIDPRTAIASTLAIRGTGTEYFYSDGDNLQMFTGNTNQITHMMGDSWGPGVIHRAPVTDQQRIVLIIFWVDEDFVD